jgi:hypothetical protein
VSKQVTVILGRQMRIGAVGEKKYTLTLRDDTKNACRNKTYRKVTVHMNCFRSGGILSPSDVCVVFVYLVCVTASYLCIIHLH